MKRFLCVLIAAVMFFAPLNGLTVQAAEPWRAAYAEFLREYASLMGTRWNDGLGVTYPFFQFFLHDMNNDGIPELLIMSDDMRGASGSQLYNLFQYDNGEVVFIRGVGDWGFFPFLVAAGDSLQFPGLFFESLDGLTYYEIEGSSVVSVPVANDAGRSLDLYNELARLRQQERPPNLHDVTAANIAAHIYGITVTANSHPFAIELQNISDNAGHTFESATLINLDNRGEQQGVAVRIWNEDNWDDSKMIIIYMVGNSIRRFEQSPIHDIRYSLSANNMLVGGAADGSFVVNWEYRLQNGELQSRTLSKARGDFEGEYIEHMFRDWTPISSGTRGENTAISRNRYNELLREWGLEYRRPLPDQTAQILAMQATTAAPPTAPAQPPPTVTINGAAQSFEVPPQIINDRTMLPLRAIGEALGMVVDFDAPTNTAILTARGMNITHVIRTAEISVNGATQTFDVPSMIAENRTLVPVRMLAEAVGADVDWDGTTRTVIITTN